MKDIKKLMITLVALIAVTTGAWAQTETLLTTITFGGTSTYSETTSGVVSVTATGVSNYNAQYGWLWFGEGSLSVTAEEGYTITKCVFIQNAKTPITDTEAPFVIHTNANGCFTENAAMDGVTSIEVYGPAPATGPEVAWNKTSKTGTFDMPGGNVELEPEYYPQAALTAVPTAINDVPATTDGAIVKAGTVKNIGETANAQGTVMYYVSTTTLDDAALLALAADAWTADVPTAESFTAAGTAHVYYYVRGNESDTDDEIFSDGDILATNKLTVTIAAAPTYAVTFAEGTDPNEWTASPNANVTKGETVTVSYSGTKKVIGVKAEKKAAAAGIVNPVVGQIIGSDGKNYDANATLPTGVTAVAVIAYVGSETGDDTYKNGLAIALADESGSMNWSTAMSTCGAKTAITGAKWCLPSQGQWKQMFKANGGNEGSYNGLNTTITTAGGTTLQEDVYYWSSSELSPGVYAYYVYLYYGNAYWSNGDEDFDVQVRACLAF